MSMNKYVLLTIVAFAILFVFVSTQIVEDKNIGVIDEDGQWTFYNSWDLPKEAVEQCKTCRYSCGAPVYDCRLNYTEECWSK